VGGDPDQKSPVYVARDTAVVSGTWSMCHDKSIWGDEADESSPDLWIGQKISWGVRTVLGWSSKFPCPTTGHDSCYVPCL
jgi:hypothetical protein